MGRRPSMDTAWFRRSERRRKKGGGGNFYSFLKFSVGRGPSMDTAWGRRSENKKGTKIPTHITEISVWDDELPWTQPGVEG